MVGTNRCDFEPRRGFLLGRIGILGAVVSAALGEAAALADGMFAPRVRYEQTTVGKAVASDRQEAILVLDGESVQVTLRTRFEAGTKELAWIVPVPSKPEFVKEGDELMFQVLEELTTPVFTRQVAQQRSGLGCGSGATTETVGRLAVCETGRAGIFDYTVLRGTSVRACAPSSDPKRWTEIWIWSPPGPKTATCRISTFSTAKFPAAMCWTRSSDAPCWGLYL